MDFFKQVAEAAARQQGQTIREDQEREREEAKRWLDTPEGVTWYAYVRGWVKGASEMAASFGSPEFATFSASMFSGLTRAQALACLEHMVDKGELVEGRPLDAAGVYERVFARVFAKV